MQILAQIGVISSGDIREVVEAGGIFPFICDRHRWQQDCWNMRHKLGLHTHLLPQMERAAKRAVQDDGTSFGIQLQNLIAATIFDCRALPIEFVDDTGDTMRYEAEQTGERFSHLPHNACYFEFRDEFSVLATIGGIYDAGGQRFDQSTSEFDHADFYELEVYGYSSWRVSANVYLESLSDAYARITNGYIVGDLPQSAFDDRPSDTACAFYEGVNVLGPAEDHLLEKAVRRLLGVLGLLRDRLLIEEHTPDPMPLRSAKNKKKGKIPISGEARVLTINVPAVRYAVSRSAAMTNRQGSQHESPKLHWRRGHWRVLHRGSEFESMAWVRRCLVGDPERGFVRTDYRLTNEMPMLTKSSVMDLPNGSVGE